MVPKVMMVATRPNVDGAPLFQTQKVLSNLPPYMLEPLNKMDDFNQEEILNDEHKPLA